MTNSLRGSRGEIRLGDQVVATKTAWSLETRSAAVDPERFVRLTDQVSGTFSGLLDATADLNVVTEGASRILLYQPMRLPWWKAWYYRRQRKPWPSYVAVEGDGYVDYTSYDGRITGQYRFTGPVTIHLQQMSWVEKLKGRFGAWWYRQTWANRGGDDWVEPYADDEEAP